MQLPISSKKHTDNIPAAMVNNNNNTLDMFLVLVQTLPQLIVLIKFWKTRNRWGQHVLPEQQSPFRLPRATPPGDDDHTHLWQDTFVYLFGAPERITILSIIVAETIDWKRPSHDTEKIPIHYNYCFSDVASSRWTNQDLCTTNRSWPKKAEKSWWNGAIRWRIESFIVLTMSSGDKLTWECWRIIDWHMLLVPHQHNTSVDCRIVNVSAISMGSVLQLQYYHYQR